MSSSVCRVLVIEDKQSSADAIERLIRNVAAEVGRDVDVVQLVRDHLQEFKAVFEEWYDPSGVPNSPHYKFDYTSLDLIFQKIAEIDEADGGERLHIWLDRRGVIPHLGTLVVRSNKYSKYFAQIPGTTFAFKEMGMEANQWRRWLRRRG